MMVIELTDDRFGKTMKNLSCIEDMLNEIKCVFKLDSMGLRSMHPYYEDGYFKKEFDRERKDPREYNRYI